MTKSSARARPENTTLLLATERKLTTKHAKVVQYPNKPAHTLNSKPQILNPKP